METSSDHSYASTFEEAMRYSEEFTYISVFAQLNTVVPEDINTLVNLEELHLFDSNIKEIGNLTSLEKALCFRL